MLDIPAQIVPVDGDIKYNGDPQSKFEDVLPEMVISRYGDMRYGEWSMGIWVMGNEVWGYELWRVAIRIHCVTVELFYSYQRT